MLQLQGEIEETSNAFSFTLRKEGEIEEIEDKIDRKFKQFKNFEVISSPPPDHNFKNRTHGVWLGSSLGKKIHQEWTILEASLPNSIFVRAYRNRINLMRAVVIGPPGTPYHHGLFFFDIFFPRNYPSTPPEVFYHSQGLDLNPSLDRQGKVYLGLLATSCCGGIFQLRSRGRYESQSENWNHQESNILQVLESIQCLILNAKPYLNKSPRLDQQNESEILKYNENAFRLTCKAMMAALKTPLGHFEYFVAGHFRQRAHPILLNFRKRADRKQYSMRLLFFELIKVFEANGVYCRHHLFWTRLEETPDDARSTNLLVTG